MVDGLCKLDLSEQAKNVTAPVEKVRIALRRRLEPHSSNFKV